MKNALSVIIVSLLTISCVVNKKERKSISINEEILVNETNNFENKSLIEHPQTDSVNNEEINSALKHAAFFDKDSLIRLEAVKTLNDEEALKHVAYFDSNVSVRMLATNKISSESYLQHVAYFDESVKVRQLAVSKIKSVNILTHIIKFDKDYEVRITAINILSNLKTQQKCVTQNN